MFGAVGWFTLGWDLWTWVARAMSCSHGCRYWRNHQGFMNLSPLAHTLCCPCWWVVWGTLFLHRKTKLCPRPKCFVLWWHCFPFASMETGKLYLPNFLLPLRIWPSNTQKCLLCDRFFDHCLQSGSKLYVQQSRKLFSKLANFMRMNCVVKINQISIIHQLCMDAKWIIC